MQTAAARGPRNDQICWLPNLATHLRARYSCSFLNNRRPLSRCHQGGNSPPGCDSKLYTHSSQIPVWRSLFPITNTLQSNQWQAIPYIETSAIWNDVHMVAIQESHRLHYSIPHSTTPAKIQREIKFPVLFVTSFKLCPWPRPPIPPSLSPPQLSLILSTPPPQQYHPSRLSVLMFAIQRFHP